MKVYKVINKVVSGIVIALILLFMIGEQFTIWNFSTKEIILSIFFPIGLIIGLSIGFFKQRAGGYIAVLSFIGFYVTHLVMSGRIPEGIYLFVFTLPGFSLLFYSLIIDYQKGKKRKI